jgi:acylphosphatase
VSGHVQGVFFRAWTQQQARELGVNGWVRNCADGSVEAHLEGDEAAIEALIQRLWQGPTSAEVNEVQAESASPNGLRGFEVRR